MRGVLEAGERMSKRVLKGEFNLQLKRQDVEASLQSGKQKLRVGERSNTQMSLASQILQRAKECCGL